MTKNTLKDLMEDVKAQLVLENTKMIDENRKETKSLIEENQKETKRGGGTSGILGTPLWHKNVTY